MGRKHREASESQIKNIIRRNIFMIALRILNSYVINNINNKIGMEIKVSENNSTASITKCYHRNSRTFPNNMISQRI